ncbi:MAG: Hsp20/alpha crystallin family protein [Deltaproteobacteria bacterium]|nr:Hsp20/alpha crystallin family protein [Deltaproteobacteria bacterium]
MELSLCRPVRERESWEASWLDDPPWSMRDWETFHSSPMRGERDHIAPPADVIDMEDRFVIKMDMPSADRDSIRIQAHDGMLSVFAEKKDKESEMKGCYCRHERRSGHFGRSFRMTTMDSDKIDASYEDGVLTISIPKSERTTVRQIPIKKH